MQLTSFIVGLMVLPAVCSLNCFKAVGTKEFRPSSFHSTKCMGHVSSCYSLTTKEDVVGHIVEGSEFDCDNQNVCAGLEGTCMTQENSVRCCCTVDNCNTAKRTVVINSAMKVTSSATRYGLGVILVVSFLV